MENSWCENFIKLQNIFECLKTNDDFFRLWNFLINFKNREKGQILPKIIFYLQIEFFCAKYLKIVDLSKIENFQIPEKILEKIPAEKKEEAKKLVAKILADAAEMEKNFFTLN